MIGREIYLILKFKSIIYKTFKESSCTAKKLFALDLDKLFNWPLRSVLRRVPKPA